MYLGSRWATVSLQKTCYAPDTQWKLAFSVGIAVTCVMMWACAGALETALGEVRCYYD